MYKEAKPFPSFWVGCNFACVYCEPSFQRQMKRRKCLKCYNYTPHEHPERFHRRPPKTGPDDFIFLDDFGDVYFAPDDFFIRQNGYCASFPDRTFLIQSKAPECFRERRFPPNIILGTTIETNRGVFNTPSRYKGYSDITNAPLPLKRYFDMTRLLHKRRAVTIEPILDFDMDDLCFMVLNINPEIVYIGYDSHPKINGLPEPPLEKTHQLIGELERRGIRVRRKLIREAWWVLRERQNSGTV